jgi:F0F1-type ATP synthase assembly protein I
MSGSPPAKPGKDKGGKSLKKRRMGVAELKMLAAASSIGIAMVLSVFFGLAAGYWLDGRFQTKPLFILLGLLVGLAAAFNNLIVLSRRLERQRKEFYGEPGKEGRGGPGGPGAGPGSGSAPEAGSGPGGEAGAAPEAGSGSGKGSKAGTDPDDDREWYEV